MQDGTQSAKSLVRLMEAASKHKNSVAIMRKDAKTIADYILLAVQEANMADVLLPGSYKVKDVKAFYCGYENMLGDTYLVKVRVRPWCDYDDTVYRSGWDEDETPPKSVEINEFAASSTGYVTQRMPIDADFYYAGMPAPSLAQLEVFAQDLESGLVDKITAFIEAKTQDDAPARQRLDAEARNLPT